MLKRLVCLASVFIASLVSAAEFVPIIHSTAYESAHIITTNPNLALYWITVTWQTPATRWLIVYNSKTVPSDGMLDTTKIMYCAIISLTSDGAPGTKSFDWTNHPLQHDSNKTINPAIVFGTVAIISVDSMGCIAKTADGNNDWITAGFN